MTEAITICDRMLLLQSPNPGQVAVLFHRQCFQAETRPGERYDRSGRSLTSIPGDDANAGLRID
jgi:hypothetical protein